MSEVVVESIPDTPVTEVTPVQEVAEVKPPARPEYEELIFRGGFNEKDLSPLFNVINSIKKKPIVIYLTSKGGSPTMALQLTERLKSIDVPVTIISELFNSSASAMFPHIGDAVRLAYPHSVFVYHFGDRNLSGISEEELESQMRYLKVVDEDYIEKTREAIGLTKKEWKKYYSFDNILFGFEALNIGTNGMVDGLILADYRDGTYLVKTRDGNKIVDITVHRRSDLKDLPVVETAVATA